jgi:hypothetical protein
MIGIGFAIPDSVSTNYLGGIMKGTIKIITVLASLQLSAAAYAQQGAHASYEEAKIPQKKTMKEQVWGLSPQIGFFNYKQQNNEYTSRAAVGMNFDFNASPSFWEKSNLFYLGASMGFLYSHIGSLDANFFGNNGSIAETEGANLLSVPVELKFGYNLSDSFRLSARGGGNILYRSIAKSMDLGAGSDSSAELWKVYPNAGLDAEFQVSDNVSIMARPDITFTTGKNIFVATIGATFMGY